MSRFPVVKTEEVASSAKHALSTGPFGSAISSKFFVDAGVPVIRGSNLSEDVGLRLVDRDSLVFLSREKADSFPRSFARRGDLVFTCWGTIGQVGLVDERALFDEYIVSNKQMKLTPDPAKADSLFLYYVYSSPSVVASIQGQSIGSSVPGFNLGQLRNVEIPLPPLPEQRRIAEILGALDDKIELNRKMNQTLEEMAQAIFKSWFIDFDGHTEFVDSELGRIPKGWRGGPLQDLLVLQRGFDLPTTQRTPGAYSVIAAGGHHGTHKEAKVKGPGIVTGRSGKLGNVFHVRDDFWPLNTTLWVKEFRAGGPNYALRVLRGMGLEKYNSGSAVPTLNRNHVHQLSVLIPPQATLAKFERVCDCLLAKTESNLKENHTLAQLRDTLLPKLISGELRVPEAERTLEKAV